jgi:hypothetical protein
MLHQILANRSSVNLQLLSNATDTPPVPAQFFYRINHTFLKGIAHIFRLYAFGFRKRKIEAELRLKVVHFESTRGGAF